MLEVNALFLTVVFRMFQISSAASNSFSKPVVPSFPYLCLLTSRSLLEQRWLQGIAPEMGEAHLLLFLF